MFKRYSLAWVTGAIFFVLITAQWISGWGEFVRLQTEHGVPVHITTYLFQMTCSTLENWQAEFFSLLYQMIVFTYLYYAGCPLTGGSDDRLEEKLDAILRRVHPDDADTFIADLEKKYPRW